MRITFGNQLPTQPLRTSSPATIPNQFGARDQDSFEVGTPVTVGAGEKREKGTVTTTRDGQLGIALDRGAHLRIAADDADDHHVKRR